MQSSVFVFILTLLFQVLDERSVKCLFSKVWGFRDEGISSVVNALPNLGVDKVHVFRSIVSVIKRGLADKIPQVYVFCSAFVCVSLMCTYVSYYSSLRLLQVFCDAAAKTARAGDIVAVVEPMVASLVAKLQASRHLESINSFASHLFFKPILSHITQDANMRTNKDTSDVLLALAANKSVGCATGGFPGPRCFPTSYSPNFSCSPVAQADEITKCLEASAVAFADNHSAFARQRHDSRKWIHC
jgi:hypothetical protein